MNCCSLTHSVVWMIYLNMSNSIANELINFVSIFPVGNCRLKCTRLVRASVRVIEMVERNPHSLFESWGQHQMFFRCRICEYPFPNIFIFKFHLMRINWICIRFQIWYEVLRDIPADSELLAAPKVPLQLGDILNNGSQEHFSDRDTGESQFNQISKRIVYSHIEYILSTDCGEEHMPIELTNEIPVPIINHHHIGVKCTLIEPSLTNKASQIAVVASALGIYPVNSRQHQHWNRWINRN